MELNRTNYRKMTSAALRSRFLSALKRSERAATSEAYLADEFAMEEIWTVLDERGEQHPCIKNISFQAA